MILAELLVFSHALTVFLAMFGHILSIFVIPRMELAKGIRGAPNKVSTIYSLWGLGSIWKSRSVTWRSHWIFVLGLQSLMIAVYLSPIFFTDWVENEKLIIPLVFTLIQIIVTGRAHYLFGEKHPGVTSRSYAALVGSMGLATILCGVNPQQSPEGWLALGYLVKWAILLTLYISIASFVTFENSAVVPEVISRMSQIVWSVGLVMIFWAPHSEPHFMAFLEQAVKSLAVLFLYDLGRTMFAKIKTQFFENVVMSLVIPLIFLASIIIAMGF